MTPIFRTRLSRRFTALSLSLSLFVASFLIGCADGPHHNVIYSFNQAGDFGTFDLLKGKFTKIGSALTQSSAGLTPGSNGLLLTLNFAGDLYSINPATGAEKLIGPTGLADCTTPDSPCGPTSANIIGILGSTVYATDFAKNLYTVNTATGKASLVGNTGIPPVPFVPETTNADGTFNVFDFTLFSANGRLYATDSATSLDFSNGTSKAVVPAYLYQIDTTTGHATRIAPTTLNLTAVVNVDGVIYAYDGLNSQIVTLSLTTGATTKVSDDQSADAGPTFGMYAVQVPGL